ncbi:MAG: hypothetical protein ACN2B6_00315 [Rickettsiales bacterium]
MSETKTVEFEGQRYKVPTEAKYMARDDDSNVYWYANKPVKEESCWCYSKGSYDTADLVVTLCDWGDSLTKI